MSSVQNCVVIETVMHSRPSMLSDTIRQYYLVAISASERLEE